ncbi:MAG: hypothetical protein QOD56_3042, partial [Gammaproteobacteria bacterium]|nr:hypothetical protein [Gammaproteobacteria bacterium]
MRIRLWTLIALTAVTVSARAQLRLPALPVPTLPLPSTPLQNLPQTIDQADARALARLSGLRHAAIGRLIGSNRRVVEADPNGEPIVRGEVLALSPSDEAMQRALAAGFLVAREQGIAAADLRLIVLTAPEGLSTRRALEHLRKADPGGTYDYNHIYTNAGGAVDPPTATSSAKAPPASTAGPASVPTKTLATPAAQTPPEPSDPSDPSAAPPSRKAPIRVGLLDTGIDSSHPVFRNSLIHSWGCAHQSMPDLHGTAVASLLLAHGDVELYAADVYCKAPTGGAADAIVAALAWMTTERVPVINVSLVGPRNALLEHAVAALIARGYLLVAAVGNDGPTAPPLYPAAYANVVGVTGVDANRRVLLEAERGPQVMFAAPGADIKAADMAHALT